MSFTYTRDVPFPSNNPSVDAPNMRTNTNSTDDIWAVDHINFNSANSGKHKQVTLVSENTPGPQVNPASTIYTGVGSAIATAECYYKNQDATFLLSCVKAFGVYTSTGATDTFDNQYNCASISQAPPFTIITLNANVVASANVIVMIEAGSLPPNYSFTFAAGIGTLTITAAPTAGQKYSFIIIQA
jgi:hypothetical protein